MDSELDLALQRLSGAVRALGAPVVCFSGGVDSALVLAVAAREFPGKALALTTTSSSLPRHELDEAKRVADQLGVRHIVVPSNEISRPGYVANGPDRCFHCKTELYAIAARTRRTFGLSAVVNGTNVDDFADHRPGLEAARAAGVRSPIAEAGLGKETVRAVARLLDLPVWDKPAAACLASRIPYGTPVTAERLAQVEELEQELRRLGFRQVRVRWHDRIARIETEVSELPRLVSDSVREVLMAVGRRVGFQYVTVDLMGYRTGSHNEVLPGHRLRVV